MLLKTECTHCFKALSVPSRMKMFTFLEEKDKATVSQLVEVAGLKQPTVSYHLKEMEDAGLLKSEKLGKEVRYSISHKCPFDGKKCVLS